MRGGRISAEEKKTTGPPHLLHSVLGGGPGFSGRNEGGGLGGCRGPAHRSGSKNKIPLGRESTRGNWQHTASSNILPFTTPGGTGNGGQFGLRGSRLGGRLESSAPMLGGHKKRTPAINKPYNRGGKKGGCTAAKGLTAGSRFAKKSLRFGRIGEGGGGF